MQALKVTFKLAAPILRDSERPVHLDALVAFALAEEHTVLSLGGEDVDAWESAKDLSEIFERTSASADSPGDWVWKASWLQFNPVLSKEWVNQTRRCEPDRYYDDLGKYWVGSGKKNELGVGDKFGIDTGSGQMRGYQWLNCTQWSDQAEAWAIGDQDALTHYLSRIDHLGKKGANGYGRVVSVTVEAAAEQDADKWMLRTLPLELAGRVGEQYELVTATLRAPYWDKLARVVAHEPLLTF